MCNTTEKNSFSDALDKQILKLKALFINLLDSDNVILSIPAYQRPYKWDLENISQLFKDIDTQRTRESYRFGTLVFHRELDKNKMSKLNIVDGQQRILTFILILWALVKSEKFKDKFNNDLLLEEIKDFLKKQKFNNTISQVNLHNNFKEVERLISRASFFNEHVEFLLYRCEFVIFVLDDISEAFQFFDSQNARGLDLAPHDLLKAYHLREFNDTDSSIKADTVASWESLDSIANPF